MNNWRKSQSNLRQKHLIYLKLSLFVLLEPLFNLVIHNAVFKLGYQKHTLELTIF